MGAILNASMRVDKLPKEKFVKGKDGAVYYNFTISINDDSRFGNNVGLMDSRTKEEREAKKPNVYFGNGKVVWVKDVEQGGGRILLAQSDEVAEDARAAVVAKDDSGLPF
tara:strand:+ start:3209 stop:3538 length:330 start_codon:yes stop_codon:yes gene_type:complete